MASTTEIDDDDPTATCLRGPIERIDGKLTLTIPLDVGGRNLAFYVTDIGKTVGDNLIVVIPDWLAKLLRVDDGDLVDVDNKHGRFTITAVDARPKSVQ